jgi:hypothetical protein
MRRSTPGAPIFVATLLLTACANTHLASLTPGAEPSIPPGLRQIAASYLDLVDASNAATCTFNAALSQPAPALADLKRASATYADSLGGLSSGLRRLDWPAEVGDDAGALIYALGTNYRHVHEMAVAETMSAFIDADNKLIEANRTSAAAATQLRRDLGLASAGNPCPG